MLGVINSSLKPEKIKLYLAKPNREIIASLKEAKIPNFNLELSQISEIKFEIPYEIQIKDKKDRNPNVDKIRTRFLVKAVQGDYEEWFTIRPIENNMDESDAMTVTIFGLGYELNDKTVREFKEESKSLDVIAGKLLSSSIWNVGFVDNLFKERFRTFEHTGSVLEGIFELAKTFEALIQWDTHNRRINFVQKESLGNDKGLILKYGKYLKSLNLSENPDEMVTQLELFGSEGLTIHSVNPTGSGYIENFSYFLEGFERDTNGNVISSSPYMSDSLCAAILDYNKKAEDSKTTFTTKLFELNEQQKVLTTKQNEKDALDLELILIQDEVEAQQALKTYFRHMISRPAYLTPLQYISYTDAGKSYVIMGKVSTTQNLTFKFNNVAKTLTAGSWQYIDKFTGVENHLIDISGSGSGQFDFIIMQITQEEMDTTGNSAELIKKYCEPIKQEQVDTKQLEVDAEQAKVDSINQEITTLRNSLSVENNFTSEQIVERNQFEIRKEVTNDYITDAQDLYDFGVEEYAKLSKPKSVLKMNIVNFLSVVECAHDWKKLSVGDIITVQYDKFGLDAKLRLLGVNRTGEDDEDIDLIISDIIDPMLDEDDEFNKILSNAMSTSTTLNMNKYKYDEITKVNNSVQELMSNTWDAVSREIIAGVNESVEVNRRGITITDPLDPLKFLRATHGIMAITNDGGLTFKHAITSDGIIGEQIIGKIFIGQQLSLENDSGKFSFTNDGVQIENAAFRLVGNSDSTALDNGIRITPEEGLLVTRSDDLVRTALNATDGIKVQKRNSASDSWSDVFYVDTNGKLTAEELVAKNIKIVTDDPEPITIIDAATKTIDFSAFNSILGNLSFSVMKGDSLTLGGAGNGNGFLQLLNENGELAVDLNAERRGFDQLYVANFESPSVVTYSNEDLTFYVSDRTLTQYTGAVAPDDENNGTSWYAPLATVTEALRRIPASYDGNCQIWIAADSILYEDINLRGYTGKGVIIVDGQRTTTKIVGNLSAGGNMVNLRFNNFTINGRPNSYSVISSFQNNYAVFQGINLYGNNSERGFDILQSGFGQVIDCDVRSVQKGVCGRYGATVWVENTTGETTEYGVYAQGGFAVGSGNAPLGSVSNTAVASGGQIHANYTYPTVVAPTPPTPVETTKTFSSTTGNAWRDNFGGQWLNGNTVVQGYYAGYGVYRGLWIFDTSPSATVTGKTIKSMRIKVTRLSSGGSSGAVNCYFRPHNYSSLPSSAPSYPSVAAYASSFRWGESKWVNLPSSFFAGFQNGTHKGIGIYVDSTSSSNYAKFNISATLEITYA